MEIGTTGSGEQRRAGAASGGEYSPCTFTFSGLADRTQRAPGCRVVKALG